MNAVPFIPARRAQEFLLYQHGEIFGTEEEAHLIGTTTTPRTTFSSTQEVRTNIFTTTGTITDLTSSVVTSTLKITSTADTIVNDTDTVTLENVLAIILPVISLAVLIAITIGLCYLRKERIKAYLEKYLQFPKGILVRNMQNAAPEAEMGNYYEGAYQEIKTDSVTLPAKNNPSPGLQISSLPEQVHIDESAYQEIASSTKETSKVKRILEVTSLDEDNYHRLDRGKQQEEPHPGPKDTIEGYSFYNKLDHKDDVIYYSSANTYSKIDPKFISKENVILNAEYGTKPNSGHI